MATSIRRRRKVKYFILRKDTVSGKFIELTEEYNPNQILTFDDVKLATDYVSSLCARCELDPSNYTVESLTHKVDDNEQKQKF